MNILKTYSYIVKFLGTQLDLTNIIKKHKKWIHFTKIIVELISDFKLFYLTKEFEFYSYKKHAKDFSSIYVTKNYRIIKYANWNI
jgi:hypothetical protein